MRNQRDIEDQLKDFPKRRLSSKSKKRIHDQLMRSNRQSPHRGSYHNGRFKHLTAWVASVAALLLFGLLGGIFFLEGDQDATGSGKQDLKDAASEKNQEAPSQEREETLNQEKRDAPNEEKEESLTEEKQAPPKQEEGAEKDQETSETNDDQEDIGEQSEKEKQPPDIREISDQVLSAIAERDMKALAAQVHPEKGLLFSPYVNVEEAAVTVDKGDVPSLLDINETWTWGHYDGSGKPIELKPSGFFEEFLNVEKYMNDPDIVLINDPRERGNTVNNIKDVFPDAKVVEYYNDGSEEYAGIDWSSINLVYEQDRENRWKLVAIVRDMWTV